MIGRRYTGVKVLEEDICGVNFGMLKKLISETTEDGV